MVTIAIIIGIAWVVRMVDSVLFHVALWQRKEYRWDRMRAHLSTANGKRLTRHPVNILKFIALISVGSFAELILLPIVLVFWIIEAMLGLRRFFTYHLLLPTLTSRTLLIVAVTFVLIFKLHHDIFLGTEFFQFDPDTRFLGKIAVALLFDRLLPFWIAGLAFATQPSVEWRKRQIVRQAKRKMQKIRPQWVIGITGSYGKTSTKEFLAHILSRKFKVLKTSEHVNADIGIARQILKELKSEHEVYVVEMGAYHIGAIKRDCEMVQPNIGILTAIAPQHLSLFGSMENLIMAKSELFGALPTSGLGIANGDQVVCHDIAKVSRAPVKFFGLRDPADVVAKKIEVTSQQLSFDIHIEKEHARVVAPLLGDLFVPNLLAAIAVAHYLGMTLSEIVAAIESLPGLPRTMEQRTGPGGIIIIDDSYSANPDGVVAALNALKVFPGRKYLVMPSMIELGTEYRAAHERVGEQAGTICNAIFLTDQDAIDHIKRGVERSSTIDKIKTSKNSTDLASLIFQSLVPGDVLLIEGRIPESLRQRFIL